MNYLIFDTETSGLPQKGAGLAGQPWLLQLGAILLDEQYAPLEELNVLVNYGHDVPIHPKAAEAHGITNERCRAQGLPPSEVFLKFESMRRNAEVLVAHNKEFDDQIWATFAERLGQPTCRPASYCTMLAMVPIMRIPFKTKRPGWKWPNLMEAYGHVTGGQKFDGAHDAMADVRAVVEVFKWLRERPRPAAQNPAPARPAPFSLAAHDVV